MLNVVELYTTSRVKCASTEEVKGGDSNWDGSLSGLRVFVSPIREVVASLCGQALEDRVIRLHTLQCSGFAEELCRRGFQLSRCSFCCRDSCTRSNLRHQRLSKGMCG